MCARACVSVFVRISLCVREVCDCDWRIMLCRLLLFSAMGPSYISAQLISMVNGFLSPPLCGIHTLEVTFAIGQKYQPVDNGCLFFWIYKFRYIPLIRYSVNRVRVIARFYLQKGKSIKLSLDQWLAQVGLRKAIDKRTRVVTVCEWVFSLLLCDSHEGNAIVLVCVLMLHYGEVWNKTGVDFCSVMSIFFILLKFGIIDHAVQWDKIPILL